MAVRTLSEIRARIARHTGLSASDADNKQIIDDFINESYQDIVRRHDWRFLMKEGIIYSVTPIDAGTITVSSSTVTGVSTGWTSDVVGGYIEIQAIGDETHLIDAFNSSTSLTLATEVSTDQTIGDSYQIFKSDFGLADGVTEGSLKYLVDTKDSRRIPIVPLQEAELRFPNQGSAITSDTVEIASFAGYNSNLTPILRLYPIPNEVRAYKYVAIDDVQDLATDASIPVIPERYQNSIEEGSKQRVYNWLGKFDRAQLHEAKFESYIKDMRRDDMSNALHVFERAANETIDLHGQLRGLRLPPSYGRRRY